VRARAAKPAPEKRRLNRLELSGRLLELGALRYTPAGVAAIEFKVAHESEQDEAGGRRKVTAEIGAIAFETQAKLLAGRPLGSEVKLQGFMSVKSKRSKKLVMHVTNIEFKEGEADASTS
jgi:primosomal replication protein N